MSASTTPRTLRDRLSDRRARRQRIEDRAEQQVVADEAALGSRSRTALPDLRQAGRAFWRHPSPWIIATTLAIAVGTRFGVGGWSVADAIVPAAVLVAFPFVEWIVHVFILHFRPATIGRVTIDPRLARDHRAHHADPRDIPLVFIPWQVYWWLLPSIVAVSLLAFPDRGTGMTYLVTVAGVGLVYEWVHYLIHSDYKPRTAAYRAVWRNHRLHHYKNENYWFTVTTARTSDRVFRTCPDPATVPSSPTAKDLLAGMR